MPTKRGFDDHRAAGSNGWTHLVGDEIQRMIEGAKGHDDAHRFMTGEGQTTGRSGVQVHRDLRAHLRAQGVYTDLDAVDGAVCFHQGIDERFSAFPGGFQGQFLPARPHDSDRVLQYFDAPGGGEPDVSVPKQTVGGLQGMIYGGLVGPLDGSNQGAVVGSEDLHGLAVGLGAGNDQGKMLCREIGLHAAPLVIALKGFAVGAGVQPQRTTSCVLRKGAFTEPCISP